MSAEEIKTIDIQTECSQSSWNGKTEARISGQFLYWKCPRCWFLHSLLQPISLPDNEGIRNNLGGKDEEMGAEKMRISRGNQ